VISNDGGEQAAYAASMPSMPSSRLGDQDERSAEDLLTKARQLNEQAEELSEIADHLRQEAKKLRQEATSAQRAVARARTVRKRR
jgi:hypothetical protein